jgi:putative addiction module component (TIGR02574 family)
MTETGRRLKAELLNLTSEDRAELAYFLIRSLDEEPETGVQAAWEAELERRWQEMEGGNVAGVPADEVFAELRKTYRPERCFPATCSTPNASR